MAFPTGWTGKHKITIDHTKVSGTGNLTDFPVLLTEANFLTDAFDNSDNGGGDIRFSSDTLGTTQLSCEIVTWDNGATNVAEVWVKIPTLSYTTDTIIYVWYANTGQTQPARNAAYGSDDVWGTNAKLIAHYSGEDGSTTYLDSSPSNRALTSYGTAQIDTAQAPFGVSSLYLDGNSDYVTMADSADWDFNANFTVDMWVRLASVSAGIYYHILGNSDWINGTDGWALFIQEGSNLRVSWMYSGGWAFNSSTFAHGMSANTWNKITLTRIGTAVRVAVNGVEKYAGTNNPATSITATNIMYQGRTPPTDAQRYLNGYVKRTAVVKGTGNTAGWIVTEYNNQSAPATFATASVSYTPGIKDLLGMGFIPSPR